MKKRSIRMLGLLLALLMAAGALPAAAASGAGTDEEEAVSAVVLTGGTQPETGAAPDSSSWDVPAGAHYILQELHWVNVTENRVMAAGDTFEAGKQYMLYVIFSPVEGYAFAAPADMGAGLADIDTAVYSVSSIMRAGVNLIVYYYFAELRQLLTLTDAQEGAGGVFKILRWRGMDHAETNEPTDRGYDPTMISRTFYVLAGGERMAYSAENTAEIISRLTPERYTAAGGYVPLTAETDAESGALIWGYEVSVGGQTSFKPVVGVTLQSDGEGDMQLVAVSLAPGCVRVTFDGAWECCIITPGDVNLDGEMNANDWGAVMRVLAEAPGEHDVTDYPGFAVGGMAYDLWALLADMTSTSTQGERSVLVDGNDWGIMMYLLAEAWR